MPGHQLEEIRDALCAAFNRNTLAQMLRFRLDRNVWAFVPDGPFEHVTFDLLVQAEAEGWTAEVVRAAHLFNPGNPRLREVYEKYGAAPEAALARYRAWLLAACGFVYLAGLPADADLGAKKFDLGELYVPLRGLRRRRQAHVLADGRSGSRGCPSARGWAGRG